MHNTRATSRRFFSPKGLAVEIRWPPPLQSTLAWRWRIPHGAVKVARLLPPSSRQPFDAALSRSQGGLESIHGRRQSNEMESPPRRWASKLHTSLMVAFLLMKFTCACSSQVQQRRSTDPASDVYEKLESYGFPEGLLPHIVTGYTLQADGRFALYLASKCQVLIERKYPLVYGQVITGVLSYGKLQGLKGIAVKAFYIWWNIGGIALGDDESLFFDIGILSTKFSCDHFDDPPICEAHSSVEAAFMDPVSLL